MRVLKCLLCCAVLALLVVPGQGKDRARPAGLKLLVLGGGTNTTHKFLQNSGYLVSALTDKGTINEATYTEDLDDLRAGNLADYDALLIYAWRANGHGGSIETDEQRQGLADFVRNGKGLVVAHIGVGCFDDWPEYGQMIGARWVSGTSTHSPYTPFEVQVRQPRHDIAGGVGDFHLVDELYHRLVVEPEVKIKPLFTAEWAGERHPMAWARKYGKGRVFVTVLGHGSDSWQAGGFQRLMRNGLLWVTRN